MDLIGLFMVVSSAELILAVVLGEINWGISRSTPKRWCFCGVATPSYRCFNRDVVYLYKLNL